MMCYCLYLRLVDRQASWVKSHRYTDTFSAALNALAAPVVNTLRATRLILGSNHINSAGPRLYNRPLAFLNALIAIFVKHAIARMLRRTSALTAKALRTLMQQARRGLWLHAFWPHALGLLLHALTATWSLSALPNATRIVNSSWRSRKPRRAAAAESLKIEPATKIGLRHLHQLRVDESSSPFLLVQEHLRIRRDHPSRRAGVLSLSKLDANANAKKSSRKRGQRKRERREREEQERRQREERERHDQGQAGEPEPDRCQEGQNRQLMTPPPTNRREPTPGHLSPPKPGTEI
ncbi:hypothetical protein B0H13DRAFT_1854728 [Mycena leptocephala]|nr:hypothetical protein B0H13DRAFT_1854728 [Mycena leptocephala]